MQWFRKSGEKAFSTCALTQAGFVRIVTNPTFLQDKITFDEARQLLDDLTSMKGHTFWPTHLSFLWGLPFTRKAFSLRLIRRLVIWRAASLPGMFL
jgi:uncharacterized protein